MARFPAAAVLLFVLLCACGVSVNETPAANPPADATYAVSTESPAATSRLPQASPTTPTAAPGVVTLNAVGDLMLARDITDLMDAHGSLYPFERVRALLADADITVANLEGTFTDRGSAAVKSYTFRTPPRHARGLAEAGIDVVALGNNHVMDFGGIALADTVAALDAAGVRYSGAGVDDAGARRPAIVAVRGIRVAFLSYDAVLETTFAGPAAAGVARADLASVQRDIIAARAAAEIVVVSMHAGSEYTDAPTAEQRALAHAAIDAGAVLVLGSHPHVLQGWERYKNGLIVFSLGNFVFDLDRDDLATLGPRPFQTLVLRVELSREGALNAAYRPVYIDPDEDRPRPATPEEAKAIDERLAGLNAALR